MAIEAAYLGITLRVDDADEPNRVFFRHCREGMLHLQACAACRRVHYPPSPACPFCGGIEQSWTAVGASGSVYSFTEVHHATNAAYKPYVPYMVAIVELDAQRGEPAPTDAIRIPAPVVLPDGSFAPPAVLSGIGINSRMRMVFRTVSEDIAFPAWTPDETSPPEAGIWRPA